MKRLFSTVVLISLCSSLFFSCGKIADTVSSNPKKAPSSSMEASVPEFSEVSANETSSSDEKIDTTDRDALLYTGGPTDMCKAHNPWYHSIPVGLLEYVGWEESNQWERELQWNDTNPDFYPFNEGMNIENFIHDFQITKEVFLQCVRPSISIEDLERVSADDGVDHTMTEAEYYNRYSFTDTEIDALFSDDQKQINRVFCGPLAFVSEADGELYSIYWLAEHSASDYVTANLPMDKVQEIIGLAKTGDFSGCTDLGQEAEATLQQAEAIEASADAKE